MWKSAYVGIYQLRTECFFLQLADIVFQISIEDRLGSVVEHI